MTPIPEDDGVDRGLINLFIDADIERQFECIQSCFSDALTYRFRLRPLARSGGTVTHRTAEQLAGIMLLAWQKQEPAAA